MRGSAETGWHEMNFGSGLMWSFGVSTAKVVSWFRPTPNTAPDGRPVRPTMAPRFGEGCLRVNRLERDSLRDSADGRLRAG